MPRPHHAPPGPPRTSRPDSADTAQPARSAEALPAARASTFVVRLWQEPRANAADAAIWRGTVSDLHGHALGSFSSASELVQLIGHASGATFLLQLRV